MVQYSEGDSIGDCPGCDATDAVIYRGSNEGVCKNCGSVYEVSFDDDVEDTPPPPPPPAPLPKAPARPAAKSPADIGKLADIPVAPEPIRRATKLNPEINTAVTQAKAIGLPDYLIKSRPWRWAHELNNVGNPYRSDSKNWLVFNVIAESGGMCVEDVVAYLAPKLGDKVSYLLTVYEVITQCVAAGLLVIDPASRMIRLCQSTPKPAPLP